MSEYNGQKFPDARVPEGAIIMGRMDVVMYMDPSGEDVIVAVRSDDGHGERVSLLNSLGMIEMAKKVIIDLSEPARLTEDEE